jgi:hypothetical protein
MANEEMWNRLFERVDSFKAALKPTETDARDAFILAFYGFSFSFVLEAVDHPSGARKLKDGIVAALQQTALSHERLKAITEVLTEFCDIVETKFG